MKNYLILFIFFNILVGQANASLWLVSQKNPERGGFATGLYDQVKKFKDTHKNEGIEEFSSAGGQLFPTLTLLDIPAALESALPAAFPANDFLIESFSDILAAAKSSSALPLSSIEEATPLLSAGSFANRAKALRGLEALLAKADVTKVSLENRDSLIAAIYQFAGLTVGIYNQRYFAEQLAVYREVLPTDNAKIKAADYAKAADVLNRPEHQAELLPFRTTTIEAITLISSIPGTASEAYLLHSGTAMDFAGLEVLLKNPDAHFSSWLKLVEKSVTYTLDAQSSTSRVRGTYCGGSSGSAPPRFINSFDYRTTAVGWLCTDKTDPFDINNLPLYPIVLLSGPGAESRQAALVQLYVDAEARQQQVNSAKLQKQIDDATVAGKKEFADIQKRFPSSNPLTPAQNALAEKEFVKSMTDEVEKRFRDIGSFDQFGGVSTLDGILYTAGYIPFAPGFRYPAKDGVIAAISLYNAVWDALPAKQSFPSYRAAVADAAIGALQNLARPENKAVAADADVEKAITELTSRLRAQYGKFIPKGF